MNELIGTESYELPPAVEELRQSINAEWSTSTSLRIEAETARDELLSKRLTSPDRKLPSAIRALETRIVEAIKSQVGCLERYARTWPAALREARAAAVEQAIQAEPRELARLRKALEDMGFPKYRSEGERDSLRLALWSHPAVIAARGMAEQMRVNPGPAPLSDEDIAARIGRLEVELDKVCRAASAAAA